MEFPHKHNFQNTPKKHLLQILTYQTLFICIQLEFCTLANNVCTDHPLGDDDVDLLHREVDVFYAAFDQGDLIL